MGRSVGSVLSQRSLDYLVIAGDLAQEATDILDLDDDLERAYGLFGLKDLRLIPVVDGIDRHRVIGVVRRDEMIDYYNKRLIDTMRN